MEIWLILCFALIIRLPLLNGSFWLDEAAQALESSRAWAAQLEIKEDFQPPLLHLITALTVRISTAEWWLRLWGALLPGLGSIFFTYKIAVLINKNNAMGKFSAVATSLLLATSSFHIYYSQELRPYALTMFWSTISWFILLQLNFFAVGGKSWQRYGLFWTGVNALGLYSSYLYPFVLIGQTCYILTQKVLLKNLFKWLKLVALTGCMFLPWVFKFSEQLATGQLLRENLPGWENVVATPQLKAIGLVAGKFIFGVSDLSINYFYGFFAGALMICFFYCLYKIRKTITHPNYLIVFFWLVLPLSLIWLVSFFIPIIQPKRVIFILPVFYLFIVQLALSSFNSAKTNLDKIIPIFFIVSMFFLNITGTIKYWSESNLQRENWRDLYFEIKQKFGKDTPKIFLFDAPFSPWVWYSHIDQNYSTKSNFTLHQVYAVNDQNSLELVKLATNNFSQQNIIYFDYLSDLSDPNRLVISRLIEHGYQPTDLLNYPQIGFIRRFEIK